MYRFLKIIQNDKKSNFCVIFNQTGQQAFLHSNLFGHRRVYASI